jgi:hypothetical protein
VEAVESTLGLLSHVWLQLIHLESWLVQPLSGSGDSTFSSTIGNLFWRIQDRALGVSMGNFSLYDPASSI